ncbi:Putative NAD(P)H nitroreductase RV3131/MT3217 [Nocardia otitidiscaviarum]|uniref:NAD(P)H nitroreductase RV3131/MT3217 n=2 Tax=Nocardia otitidiscaviarum TaxID=1823 RepID=A0A379JLL1_9NOCA|nr:Putative NAD(P)H nitroreductase RV3131/MT3217 [Nocardia otitidiscaviarum]
MDPPLGAEGRYRPLPEATRLTTMSSSDFPTTATVPDRSTVTAALELAARAPSVHNTQPWRWIFDGHNLHLYGDVDRRLPATDPHHRQWAMSCGAELHHARLAFAARGWHTDVVRLPETERPERLATLRFHAWPDPPAAVTARAEAMARRYTDRLPLAEPRGWVALSPTLRGLASPHDLALDVLDENARSQLIELSRHATAARRYDMQYRSELDWWAGHSGMSSGVPPEALPSVGEEARVGVARSFRHPEHAPRRTATDHARLVVLSSHDDTLLRWLHTGEALSAVLLECTAHDLATCALTHVTELPAARRAIADLLPHSALPQVVIRVGSVAEGERPPLTARRPLTETLTFH